jgi:hypothetical protein
MATDNFPGRPFRLRDVTELTRQDVPNNKSLIHWELWIDKISYSPTWSADGKATRQYQLKGYQMGRIAGSGFDFRAAGPWKILSGDDWVTHDNDGELLMSVRGIADYDLLGLAEIEYNMRLPTIPRDPPAAPTGEYLTDITKTSMRYRFTSNGTGDSTLITWQYQVSRQPDFSSQNRTVNVDTGNNVVEDLTPGIVYYFRSLGQNSNGWGPWSNVLSDRTLSDPPNAPIGQTLDQFTTHSIRYRFASNGTGDTPITKWQYQVSRNSDFSSARTVDVDSGLNTVDNLEDGILFYFRSRGFNAAGAGPWSNVLSGRTLSYAYISDGTSWLPAEVLISDGSQWLPAETFISDGSVWRETG